MHRGITKRAIATCDNMAGNADPEVRRLVRVVYMYAAVRERRMQRRLLVGLAIATALCAALTLLVLAP